jgi:hypothetical protein
LRVLLVLLATALGCGSSSPKAVAPSASQPSERNPDAQPKWAPATSHAFAMERALEIAYCGPSIAASSWEGTIRLYDERTGKVVRVIEVPNGGPVGTMSCDPSARFLTAVVVHPEPHRLVLHLWPLKDGGAPRELGTFESFPSYPTWSSDGRTLLVQAEGGLVAIDVASGRRRRGELPPIGGSYPMMWTAAGDVVVGHAGGETLRVYDRELRMVRDVHYGRLPAQGNVPGGQALLFAADRDNFVVAAGVEAYDVAAVGAQGTRVMTRLPSSPSPIAALPDHRILAYRSEDPRAVLVIIDARTGKETFRAPFPEAWSNSIHPQHVRGDGRSFVLVTKDGVQIFALP